MPKITVLDEATINQIAAGEVIERPSAVVKELVENSIDAGSTVITVEIKEGGISFLRITDNGSGIEEGDMPYVFLRHSTSKIRTADDLLRITSLGFRGEALSSIAAVAQVELVTKTSESFTGIRYLIDGGVEKGLEHIGCPEGTTFIIRNLFFNTPARKKFLKSAVTEAGYIQDFMERIAISHPQISFKFIVNGQVKLHTSGNNNQKDVIYHIFGRDITSHLISVKGEEGDLTLTGFIAKPAISRGNRNYENYFINGRFVKNPIIYKAIEEAFKPYIMLHRYPFTALMLTIDTELIDVNVHPAKLEVRFKNGEELYRFIYNTIRNTLEGRDLITEVHLTKEDKSRKIEQKLPEPFEVKRRQEEGLTYKMPHQPSFSYDNTKNNSPVNSVLKEAVKATEIGQLKAYVDTAPTILLENKARLQEAGAGLSEKSLVYREEAAGIPQKEKNDLSNTLTEENVAANQPAQAAETIIQAAVPQNTDSENTEDINIDSNLQKTENDGVYEQLAFLSEKAVTEHKIIGQLFNTYWIIEYGDKMFLIDQHAAHEKVLYERIIKKLKEKEHFSQQLMPPIILSLTIRERDALLHNMKYLEEAGFEFEEFGGKEYAVRAVPGDLYNLVHYDILIEIIDGLTEESYNSTPEIILDKIASMSCKAAVKGSHKLSVEEARALIEQLLTLENPYNCPHGRPVIISMSKYEVERKFKRIV
ncbi:DNA mismatch repair endonuclease MutL [Anaerocolumna sp. AGMB13020]|uniref:DNA mismatch repair endonuclease MutL n=1 Tax=Anaerocolumna sp. AGMB13020 TaxID=3081750 RepID=UPI002953CD2E|nr:DNA mismatch repair endonuclease MutL [Anaerocolumna sp. AGMB13020]WOO36960.1 DNA mismatch repair endonuclease MutL [Anaerocolumna sp. AGMB13020]